MIHSPVTYNNIAIFVQPNSPNRYFHTLTTTHPQLHDTRAVCLYIRAPCGVRLTVQRVRLTSNIYNSLDFSTRKKNPRSITYNQDK